ncbi:MAG: uroporphyrinogen-III synthase [Nitrososphaerales archaeon]
MLDGKVVAITRDEESAKEFVQMVESRNGKAIALPTISLVPRREEEILNLLDTVRKERYDYVLFMSANTVKIIFDAFGKAERTGDAVSLINSAKVIAVGPNTKQELERHGVNVSMMPARYSSYGVVDMLSKEDCKGKRIVVPRSAAAKNYLAGSLAKLGMRVDEVHVYDVEPAAMHDRWSRFMEMLARKEVDCIVFTSASSVNSFFEVATRYEKDQGRIAALLNSISGGSGGVVAIGPFTNDALTEHGVRAVVSEEHTIEGTFKVTLKLLGNNEDITNTTLKDGAKFK